MAIVTVVTHAKKVKQVMTMVFGTAINVISMYVPNV
jgi:hypothetical protein